MDDIIESKEEVIKFFEKIVHKNILNYTLEKEGIKFIEKIKNCNILSSSENIALKMLIVKGISNEFRKKLWMICSGALTLQSQNVSYYPKLKNISINEPNHQFREIIEKDLSRSEYRQDTFFIEKVRNVLLSYSMRCKSIGYCQGFNFIVEKIMLVIEDEVS